MMMRNILVSAIALALTSPAWAAGHGGGGMGHGASGMGHGADVWQTAHVAKQNGDPMGPSMRAAPRRNSQGPLHTSTNALSHVRNSPGQANAHSVLGDGTQPVMTHARKTNGPHQTR